MICRSTLLLVCFLVHLSTFAAAADRPPNIIIFLTDDQGYADVGCFGSKGIKTPNFDRLATEGMKFTSFYVSQAVCSASRAALMTGCYCNRVGLYGALNHRSTIGISKDEVLIPEFCRERGYATACYGKWHLGIQPEFIAVNHGFDEFFGLPYPNDNSKYHPTVHDMPPLPLIERDKAVEFDPDQSQFTRRFTERSVQFMEKNKDKPFFLYLAHVMPHVPIFASDRFKGQSGSGLYADVIEELDWSMGEVLATLKRLGLDDNTLIIFTSDNGPFLSYGDWAGSAAPFRGGKLTTFEGGMRMPCLMRWPGHIPAGKACDELVTAMDLYPTFAKLIGAKVPDVKRDGHDIWPLMSGKPGAKSPHDALYYYAEQELHAVRSGKWKLHFPHPYIEVDGPPGHGGKPANFEHMKPADHTKSGIEGVASRHGYKMMQLELSLFDLETDPGETKNVAADHPDVVQRLSALGETMRADLGDSLTDRKATGAREPGHAK